MPYEMERIDQALMTPDLFVSIGTSGAVYPAAGFVQTARYCGAKTVYHLEPSQAASSSTERRYGLRRLRGAEVGRREAGLVRPIQPMS